MLYAGTHRQFKGIVNWPKSSIGFVWILRTAWGLDSKYQSKDEANHAKAVSQTAEGMGVAPTESEWHTEPHGKYQWKAEMLNPTIPFSVVAHYEHHPFLGDLSCVQKKVTNAPNNGRVIQLGESPAFTRFTRVQISARLPVASNFNGD